MLGFEKEGVRADSIASRVQVPDVKAGSNFAGAQRLAATGNFRTLVGVIGAVIALIIVLVQ